MGDIDPIQFGQLIESVKNLSAEVQELNAKVDGLVEVKNKGFGILLGVGLAGGSVGAVASNLLHKFLN